MLLFPHLLKTSSAVSYPVIPLQLYHFYLPSLYHILLQRNHYRHLFPLLSSPRPMPSWLLSYCPIKTLANITTELPAATSITPQSIFSPIFSDLTIWDLYSFPEEIYSSLVFKTQLSGFSNLTGCFFSFSLAGSSSSPGLPYSKGMRGCSWTPSTYPTSLGDCPQFQSFKLQYEIYISSLDLFPETEICNYRLDIST